MAISLRIIALSAFLTMLFVNAIGLRERTGESKQLNSLRNLTVAERLEEFKHEHAVDDPEAVAAMVDMTIRNSTSRRNLGFFSCGTGNPIDDCWRCDRHWVRRRRRLDGRFYVVTDPGDDDPVSPRPGTLRHAVIQDRPLWIVFRRDMTITLKQELIVNSFKTIDGRGANVHVAYGACITIQFVTNVIVHGLHIHDCRRTGNAMVRSSPSHYGWRTMADGDGISIFGSSHVWIDRNTMSRCADGLIDAIMGSTAITISNNYFTHHNEVMLLGHSDSYARDRVMQVTIAYNHFGEGLIQRMPRCRHGYFHVVNNDYTHWEMYAIGGSANPTINSQGNRYLAPANPFAKEVTHRVSNGGRWRHWNWRSEGDLMLNGAYFTQSGRGAAANYARASSLAAKSSSLVGHLLLKLVHCAVVEEYSADKDDIKLFCIALKIILVTYSIANALFFRCLARVLQPMIFGQVYIFFLHPDGPISLLHLSQFTSLTNLGVLQVRNIFYVILKQVQKRCSLL